MSGREISKLVDGFKNSGSFSINFKMSDLATGVYFIRLTAQLESGDIASKTKKMLVIK